MVWKNIVAGILSIATQKSFTSQMSMTIVDEPFQSNIMRGEGERKLVVCKVSKGAKIRNRYNQVPHLTQDTNGKVTTSQLYTTNESPEVSSFPAGDHKAQINRRAQRHNKHKREKHKRSTIEVPPWNDQ